MVIYKVKGEKSKDSFMVVIPYRVENKKLVSNREEEVFGSEIPLEESKVIIESIRELVKLNRKEVEKLIKEAEDPVNVVLLVVRVYKKDGNYFADTDALFLNNKTLDDKAVDFLLAMNLPAKEIILEALKIKDKDNYTLTSAYAMFSFTLENMLFAEKETLKPTVLMGIVKHKIGYDFVYQDMANNETVVWTYIEDPSKLPVELKNVLKRKGFNLKNGIIFTHNPKKDRELVLDVSYEVASLKKELKDIPKRIGIPKKFYKKVEKELKNMRNTCFKVLLGSYIKMVESEFFGKYQPSSPGNSDKGNLSPKFH